MHSVREKDRVKATGNMLREFGSKVWTCMGVDIQTLHDHNSSHSSQGANDTPKATYFRSHYCLSGILFEPLSKM